MKALVDAEIYLHRALAASEVEAEWAPEQWTYVCRHEDAKALFQDSIIGILEALPKHEIVLVLSDTFSFRYGVWPGYKAGRKRCRKPPGYSRMLEWIRRVAPGRGWGVRCLPEVEGDDVLGILYEEGDVIVSSDKDALTLPGIHLRDGKTIEVNRMEADRAFYGQTLSGDKSDNYPGCPGIGAVSAARLLGECTTELEMWQQTLKAFEEKGHTKGYANQQARCARILRAGEYDMDTGIPVLWSPPVG